MLEMPARALAELSQFVQLILCILLAVGVTDSPVQCHSHQQTTPGTNVYEYTNTTDRVLEFQGPRDIRIRDIFETCFMFNVNLN